MRKQVEHICGGMVDIDMSDAEQRRCRSDCALFGDPPCYELPAKTSDASHEPITACIMCADRGSREPGPSPSEATAGDQLIAPAARMQKSHHRAKRERVERGYFWIGFAIGAATVLIFWGLHLGALAAAGFFK